ncbi:MAG: STAS domain-containing protein [Algoriphagus aquaeductus]|jgi:anti-anti-sigma factor|uniref:Anti-anti-sigma factor n=1 Tax=Algoriphagus aquaeductus TaxID=475299 RepID=A0A326RQY6_9BACT|nr:MULTISPECIES: STAS domain-containing protein [Algoriphagus]PZV83979.1 anti-anti-sigma factor [Algoriphagus aquaeductus]
MKYTIDKKEQYVVFSPMEEKIDSLLAPKLKSELLTIHAEGYANIVLDMSAVKYVDSSGLSALLVGDREFGRNGGIFLISGVQEHVMKLLKISMLDKKLNLVNSLEEAGEAVFMHEIDGGEDEEEA